MGILDTNPEPPEILSVREKRIGIPHHRRAEVVSFYRQVFELGIWPPTEQLPGGIGLGDMRRGLFLEFRHDPDVEPMRDRFVLIVPCLDAFEQRLLEMPWPYERFHGLGFSNASIHLQDPVGHRVRIRQARRL